jgi:NarL family two-component system response regulator LiaR
MDTALRSGVWELSKANQDGERLRVIVADDDPLARRVVRDTLQGASIVVVAEATNGREAVELALYYRPDIVLMDVVMPELDGIAATRRILEQMPEQVVVMLTGSNDDEMGMLGLRVGAVGFLSKDVEMEALPRALAGAMSGEAAISRSLARRLLEHIRTAPEGSGGLRPVKSPLTSREWEVMDLLIDQRSTDEIADTLVVSNETVRSHVKSILRKLGVRSRAEAVEAAQKMRDRRG